MNIRRLRRYGPDRFGDFPRSIYIPPAEMRRKVSNWVDFIEYLPPFPVRREVVRETVSTMED